MRVKLFYVELVIKSWTKNLIKIEENLKMVDVFCYLSDQVIEEGDSEEEVKQSVLEESKMLEVARSMFEEKNWSNMMKKKSASKHLYPCTVTHLARM